MSDTTAALLGVFAAALVLLALTTWPRPTPSPYTEADALRELDRQVYGRSTRSYSWLDDGVVTQDELSRIRDGSLR